MWKVLVTARSFRHTPGEHWRMLEEAGLEIVTPAVDKPLGEAEMIALVGDVDAVLVGVDAVTANVINAARKLKVISKHGVGVDNIDVPAATQAGIPVTITPGGNQVAVAELTVSLLLSLARRIPYHDAIVKGGGWTRKTGLELAGKTVGFVGLGRIAKEVVVRLEGFGVKFLAYDVYRDEGFAAQHGIQYVALDELLRESDIISLHAALTPESRHLIGPRELELMKKSALLINTARGDLIDEEALCQALKENRLGGAAIDTPTKEPPKDSPLLTLGDKVILTPHIGAQTNETIVRVGTIAARNVVQALRGDRPDATVNPEVYARTAEAGR